MSPPLDNLGTVIDGIVTGLAERQTRPQPEPRPGPSSPRHWGLERENPDTIRGWLATLAKTRMAGKPETPAMLFDEIEDIVFACGDLPAVCWTEATLREAKLALEWWPGPAKLARLLEPTAELLRRRVEREQEAARDIRETSEANEMEQAIRTAAAERERIAEDGRLSRIIGPGWTEARDAGEPWAVRVAPIAELFMRVHPVYRHEPRLGRGLGNRQACEVLAMADDGDVAGARTLADQCEAANRTGGQGPALPRFGNDFAAHPAWLFTEIVRRARGS